MRQYSFSQTTVVGSPSTVIKAKCWVVIRKFFACISAVITDGNMSPRSIKELFHTIWSNYTNNDSKQSFGKIELTNTTCSIDTM